MAATHTMKIDRSKLLEALVASEKIADTTSHWTAIRIHPDGTLSVSEEPSACYSQDEYYHRMPHTVTVAAQVGNGQHCVNWNNEENEEFQYSVEEVEEGVFDKLEAIEKELERAGYEVEME